ncbi:MAG TPA: hypothetical protein VEU77_04040, partial [Candidatus Acidoferrales bacterium]|nr:hypothetical protein [Candidatus Acidoferrales bacterium]
MRRVVVAIVAALFLGACSSTSTAPTRSSDVAATAKPAATATAAVGSAAPSASVQPLEVIGKFDVSPAHGAWDTKVTATATGMKANTQYDLTWLTGKVTWKLSDDKSKYLGRDAKTIQQPLASVTTDGNGAFSTTFVVP